MSRGKLISTVVALGVVLVLVVVVKAAPAVRHLDSRLISDYSWADGQGNYQFDYRTADGTFRTETGTVKAVPGTNETIIVVEGRFNWVAPDGSEYYYAYMSDQGGYRVRDIPPTTIKPSVRIPFKRPRGGIHGSGCNGERAGDDCQLKIDIKQTESGDMPFRYLRGKGQ